MYVKKPTVPAAPIAEAARKVAADVGRPLRTPEKPVQPKAEVRWSTDAHD